MECYPNGRKGPRLTVCLTNEINSYPTWIIDGRRYTKILKPEKLARITGYPGIE